MGSCTACAKGKFKEVPGDVQCVDCPAGTFSSDIGAISEQTCGNYGKNYTSPVGSSIVTACEHKLQQYSVSKASSSA